MPDVIRSARHLHGLLHLPTYIAVVVKLYFSTMIVNNIMYNAHTIVNLPKTVYKGNKKQLVLV